MENSKRNYIREFLSFTFKVIIVHSMSYFIFGLIFSNIFNYADLFRQPIIRDFMHPIDSPAVLWGPLLQPVRGLAFALGIWPLRSFLLERKYGWLILWNIVLVFGIISTPAAAPCSIEGLIYSKLPLFYHLIGLPEIILQTLSFSFILVRWLKRSDNKSERKPVNQKRAVFTRVFLVFSIACYGYIGYALGAILSAKLVGQEINLSETQVSLKNQLMFIVALLLNFGLIYVLAIKRFLSRFSFRQIFFLFFIADSSILLIYQAVFSHMMPVHMAFLIGFFPAIIISATFRMNNRNFSALNTDKYSAPPA